MQTRKLSPAQGLSVSRAHAIHIPNAADLKKVTGTLPRMMQNDGTFKKFYKAICSHEETMSWYCGKSSRALDQPPISLTRYGGTLQSGDLFINIHSDGI